MKEVAKILKNTPKPIRYQKEPYGGKENNFNGWLVLSVKEVSLYMGIIEQADYNGISRKSKNSFPVKSFRFGRLRKLDKRELDQYIDLL